MNKIVLSSIYDLGPEGKKEVPTEFKILNIGKNEGFNISDGEIEIIYDDDCGKDVINHYNESGLDSIPLDYEHQMFLSKYNGKQSPAAGWLVPESRSDGLYATNIKWTSHAKEMLLNSEYRYFSPALETDKDGRVLKLFNVALTNLPALKNIKPLIELFNINSMHEKWANNTNKEKIMETVETETFTLKVLSATGLASENEALAFIEAMKEVKASNEALTKEVEELKAKLNTAEVGSMIDEAVKDGRVPPARKEEVLNLYSKIGKDGLVCYLSMLPQAPGQNKPLQAVETNVGSFSKAEKTIMKTLGLDQEKFNKQKDLIKEKKVKLLQGEE